MCCSSLGDCAGEQGRRAGGAHRCRFWTIQSNLPINQPSPLGGATIKTMNNNETVNNVLASLYESLSDEAKEMMIDVFREEGGE